MTSHSLKYLRIAAGILFLTAISLLFVDFSGRAALWLAWTAKIQLVPALLAANFTGIIILAALTLVFGRVYCSVICPLGVSQDIVAWLRRRVSPRKKRKLGLYKFEKAHTAWRYTFLGLFIELAALGLLALIPMSFAGIVDPYSAYGRIAGQAFVPAWRSAMGSLAEAQAAHGTYLFDSVPTATVNFNIAVASVAAITFIVVAVFAFRTGRGYCNTICPVGTILGFLSRFSLLRPVIDTDKCNRCGSCGRHCKAKCIDTKNHAIDYSRCVVCMDCLNNCSQGAISYRGAPRRKKAEAGEAKNIDSGRRNFMVGTALATAAVASAKVTDGGLAPLKKKQPHKNITPSVPAGAMSLRHFRSHCTACQLCISECPNEVLRPGTSLEGFMQPVMIFTDGFCRPECNRCGTVCPTGAITPVTIARKATIKTGTAKVDASTCISAAYGQTCGNCARHCPAGAIKMVKQEDGHMRPVVDESYCIGCGSCEYHCPSGTAGQLSAKKASIYVVGLDTHQTV